MEWDDKLDHFTHLILTGKRKESDLPPEPEVGPFEWYVKAYFEIATCRSSMSGGPIPFTAIAEFARIFEVDDFFEFLNIIRLIDNVFVEESEKKEKAKGSD